MNKSTTFKKAHELAKSVHVVGECYRVTFGAALKIVIAESKAPKTLAERLLDAGAKSWVSADGKINRVYINSSDVIVSGLNVSAEDIRSNGRTIKTKSYIQNDVAYVDDGAIANVLRAANIQVIRI